MPCLVRISWILVWLTLCCVRQVKRLDFYFFLLSILNQLVGVTFFKHPNHCWYTGIVECSGNPPGRLFSKLSFDASYVKTSCRNIISSRSISRRAFSNARQLLSIISRNQFRRESYATGTFSEHSTVLISKSMNTKWVTVSTRDDTNSKINNN